MIDTALQELINFIKSVSPVLWDTLIRQVYADIATNIIWGILLIIIAFFLFRFSKKRLEDDDMDTLGIFGMIFVPIILIISPVLLTIAVRMIINPYYYAITTILGTFK